MGFFKKMGTAVKKGMKQISLKNIVKLGTPFLSMIPVVGGVVQSTVQGASDAHALKKQSAELAKQGQVEQAQAMALQAEELAQASGAIIGQQVGTQFKAFTKGASKEFMAQTSSAAQSTIGVAGASFVDFTIKEWIMKHLNKILILVGASGLAIWYFKSKKSAPRRSSYRRK